jgi:type IV pilus assembly protein PilC
MPLFVYKAIDNTGKIIKEEVTGDTAEKLMIKLSDMGLSVVSIEPKKKLPLFTFKFDKIFGSVSNKELKYFYVNLATLIDSGCSLAASISALAEECENKYFQGVLKEIYTDINSGKAFSESVEKHPKIFDQLFFTLVKAGEEGGMLDQILLRYALHVENQQKIKSKVRGAMVLPIIISIVAVGVIIGLLTYVFPTFMKLFAGKENLLPAPTLFVIWLSDTLRYNYHWLILSLLLLVGAIYMIAQTRTGWRFYCHLQLKTPLIGTLFKKMYLARFAQTLGSLMKSGVPTLRAIETTGNTIPNVIFNDALKEIYYTVERGGLITTVMKKYPGLFPSVVILMINVGETTGNLDGMFTKVATYFEAEVQEAINAILAAIEPIMTVIMGVVVLILALSMFLPLFDMGKALT